MNSFMSFFEVSFAVLTEKMWGPKGKKKRYQNNRKKERK